MTLKPRHGSAVTIRFAGSDYAAQAVRVSKEREDQERYQQGWDSNCIYLDILSSTGTLPAAVEPFFAEGYSTSLFFDVANWSETGWSVLLETSEVPVILEFADPVSEGDGKNQERWRQALDLLAEMEDNWNEDEIAAYTLPLSFDEMVAELRDGVRFKQEVVG